MTGGWSESNDFLPKIFLQPTRRAEKKIHILGVEKNLTFLSANLLSNIQTLVNPDLYVKTTCLNLSQCLSTFIVAMEVSGSVSIGLTDVKSTIF